MTSLLGKQLLGMSGAAHPTEWNCATTGQIVRCE